MRKSPHPHPGPRRQGGTRQAVWLKEMSPTPLPSLCVPGPEAGTTPAVTSGGSRPEQTRLMPAQATPCPALQPRGHPARGPRPTGQTRDGGTARHHALLQGAGTAFSAPGWAARRQRHLLQGDTSLTSCPHAGRGPRCHLGSQAGQRGTRPGRRAGLGCSFPFTCN